MLGVLNSGNIGFCLGSNSEEHFGLIVCGYETCCKQEKHVLSQYVENSINSCCDDIYINSININQTLNINAHSFDIFANPMSSPILLKYVSKIYAVKNDYKNVIYVHAPPDLIFNNSGNLKKSIILLM